MPLGVPTILVGLSLGTEWSRKLNSIKAISLSFAISKHTSLRMETTLSKHEDGRMLENRRKTIKCRLLSIYCRVLFAGLALTMPIHIGCATSRNFLAIPVNGKNETIHYVIIGFGIVTVPAPEKTAAVSVLKSQTLGAVISDQPGLKVGIGYSSGTVVLVPNGAEDVRVEVSQKFGGPLIIDTLAAKLKE
jgi:hypothetical protein